MGAHIPFPETSPNSPLSHFYTGGYDFPGHGNLSVFTVCFENECDLASSLKMPLRKSRGHQLLCPLAKSGSSVSLLYREPVGLKKKITENYLDVGDAGTTGIPGEHSVL